MSKTTVLALALLAGLGPAAMADTCQSGAASGPNEVAPAIFATINGQPLSEPGEKSYNGEVYCAKLSGSTSTGVSMSGSIVFDSDPFVSYGVTFNNSGDLSDMLFTLVVTDPYSGGPFDTAFSTMAGSVTDGGEGEVSVTPGPALDIQQPYVNGVPFGAIVGGCGEAVPLFSSNPCGEGNLLSIPMLSPASGTLEIVITADVGAGDVFNVNGAAGLFDTTPEPGSMYLMGSGLIAAWVARRRLHR
jgi:hypothetical protein